MGAEVLARFPAKFLSGSCARSTCIPAKSSGNSLKLGPESTFGGVLGTSTGLIFSCDDSGMFIAVDAATGKPVWHFQANQPWRASPMAYQFDGKELVAVASGQTVMAFGEPDK